MEHPDGWVLVKILNKELEIDCYKIFASFRGGYLNSNSWKLNSGIVAVDLSRTYNTFEKMYYFYGHSGSCYVCSESGYNYIDPDSYLTLESFRRKFPDNFIVLEQIPKDILKMDWILKGKENN